MTTDRITLVHTGLILEPGSSLSLSFFFLFKIVTTQIMITHFFLFFLPQHLRKCNNETKPWTNGKRKKWNDGKEKKKRYQRFKIQRDNNVLCIYLFYFFARWIHSCTLEHQSRIRMPCVAVQSLAETLREGERNIEIHYSIASCWAVTERCLVNPDWTSSFKTKKIQ